MICYDVVRVGFCSENASDVSSQPFVVAIHCTHAPNRASFLEAYTTKLHESESHIPTRRISLTGIQPGRL